MPNQLITCDKHGRSPGYCVCVHIVHGGAPAAHIVKATEQELGEAVCQRCSQTEPTVDDLVLLCAGCLASLLERNRHGLPKQ